MYVSYFIYNIYAKVQKFNNRSQHERIWEFCPGLEAGEMQFQISWAGGINFLISGQTECKIEN